MNLITVDLGKTGGIANWYFDKMSNRLTLEDVLDTPCDKKTRRYCYLDIFNWLADVKPDLAIIEVPQYRGQNGTLVARQTALGEGMWMCLFDILGIEYEYSNPQVWTKNLGLKNDKKLTPKQNKQPHVELAASLYPKVKHKLYGPRGGLNDGKADAILIGHHWYISRNNPGKKK